MTTETTTENAASLTFPAALDADMAAFDAHQLAINPLHRAAFRRPVTASYATGQHVWLYDHYNTGVVVCTSDRGGWVVLARDVDGTESRYTYRPDWLRPVEGTSAEGHVFVWPSLVKAQN